MTSKTVILNRSGKKGGRARNEGRASSILSLCNRAFTVLIACLSLYLAVKFYHLRKEPGLTLEESGVTTENTGKTASLTIQRKPFEAYEKEFRKRDLFQPIIRTGAVDTAVLEKALPALHKRIKLIGILVDEDSKAIVEDLQEKQTHFLSQGDSVGQIFIEDIQEDKVIFNDDGKKVEMAL